MFPSAIPVTCVGMSTSPLEKTHRRERQKTRKNNSVPNYYGEIKPHETFPLNLGLFNISSSQWFEAQLMIMIMFHWWLFLPVLNTVTSVALSGWDFIYCLQKTLMTKFLRHCSHYLKFIGKDFFLSEKWGMGH